ncbi:MAG: thiamine pyrophosphate-requiring protein [Aquisalimonadaceae bacterium]
MTSTRTTVAAQLLRLAKSLGVDFIFTNLGSDHPAFIQAFAVLEADAEGPEVICCPHEMTALSAAHGYAMITRRPQLVLVHVDVGTQNLGCSIHNVARARVPSIIIAGLSPLTLDGDRPGNRTEFIHYTQDVPAQSDIVRQYMKWSYELRAAETVQQVMQRAYQVAASSPQGPVYLTGAREVWEEQADLPPPRISPPAQMGGLTDDGMEQIWAALANARRPLVITSALGQAPEAVDLLVRLSERLELAVEEVTPQYMNFPGNHPNHVGYERNRHVAEADFILVLDSDVPWMPVAVKPAAEAPVFLVDADPLKDAFGLWSYPVNASFRAETVTVLAQLVRKAEAAGLPSQAILQARRDWIAGARQAVALPPVTAGAEITPASLSQAVADLIADDQDIVVLMEAPTASPALMPRLRMSRSQSFFSSGGSGLGWAVNSAIGVKLARPESTVVTIVGDGCYQFAVPSSAYWVAATYDTPQLTVILNNGGWNAPKRSSDMVHKTGGVAGAMDSYWITVGRDARLADIAAAAGGAAAYECSRPELLAETLREALEIVRGGRSAVVSVVMSPISQQRLGRRTSNRTDGVPVEQ